MKMINIGIIGAGVVGKSVINLLSENSKLISSRAGANILIKRIVVRNLSNFNVKTASIVSTNINDILDDETIDIVVELINDMDVSYKIANMVLSNNKILITANKAMLANNISNLVNIIRSKSYSSIHFEASVAGGVPIINAIKNGLNANNILSIKGILNGTCNYILTKMSLENISFDMCLKEAQNLGYAESDPMLDISGMDSAYKLIILGFIVYGIVVKPSDILVEGICDINQDDMCFANEFGYIIKLLAVIKRVGNKIEFRVHPSMINKNEMLSNVSGVMNGISVLGDSVGETMYCGAGAGGNATASAVVSDIINVIRDSKTNIMGLENNLNGKFELMDKDLIESKYYIRMKVLDQIGVMAKIASVFSANKISIKVVLQKDIGDGALLLLSTHKSLESNIKKAIEELNSLDVVCSRPCMIRIEE